MSFTEGASLNAALGLVLLALVPLALITLTSFAKIAVVLSILKNALGAGEVPSGAIVTALSLALTIFVMSPVFDETQKNLARAGAADTLSIDAALDALKEPLKAFLARNVGDKERKLFVELAKERKQSVQDSDLSLLWPSFALTELRRAFQLGFFVFLPFLVLDLVVANVLVATGLTGLSTNSVALPFKLLLFVSVDGLVLLAKALVLGYT